MYCTIDIETLSVKPNALVLSIGGIKFNKELEPFSPIYIKPDVDEQVSLKRDIDDSTIEWWSKQDIHAKDEAFSENDRLPLMDTINHLNKWLKGVEQIWCQGYGFDMVILESLYHDMKNPLSWDYWQIRDSRTLLSFFNIRPGNSKQDSKHHALHDALTQAECIRKIMIEHEKTVD